MDEDFELKNYSRPFAVATAAIVLQSCVTQLTPGGNNVRVITDPEKYGCEFISVATGSASMGWTTAHDAEGAFNEVMNKAAEQGANAIVIGNSDSTSAQTTAVVTTYLCDF